MSLTSDNVIPGNHGKIFKTDADDSVELGKIRTAILSVKGVKNVLIEEQEFPNEITVLTTDLVKVDEIQEVVAETGYHVVPKTLFSL